MDRATASSLNLNTAAIQRSRPHIPASSPLRVQETTAKNEVGDGGGDDDGGVGVDRLNADVKDCGDGNVSATPT